MRGGSWDVVDVRDDGIGMVVEVLDCERVGGAVMLLRCDAVACLLARLIGR